jgi:hypothetical protein
MKGFGIATLTLAGLASLAWSRELQPDDGLSSFYDTGAVHEKLMSKKMVTSKPHPTNYPN